jgi:hypothetical protein
VLAPTGSGLWRLEENEGGVVTVVVELCRKPFRLDFEQDPLVRHYKKMKQIEAK